MPITPSVTQNAILRCHTSSAPVLPPGPTVPVAGGWVGVDVLVDDVGVTVCVGVGDIVWLLVGDALIVGLCVGLFDGGGGVACVLVGVGVGVIDLVCVGLGVGVHLCPPPSRQSGVIPSSCGWQSSLSPPPAYTYVLVFAVELALAAAGDIR